MRIEMSTPKQIVKNPGSQKLAVVNQSFATRESGLRSLDSEAHTPILSVDDSEELDTISYTGL